MWGREKYWRSPVAQTRSPSSSGSSEGSVGSSAVASSSLSSASLTKAGSGPERQASTFRISSHWVLHCCRRSERQPTQQQGEHLVISTFFTMKLISGLCL